MRVGPPFLALAVVLLCGAPRVAPAAPPPADPLRAEVERLDAFLRTHAAGDALWKDIKENSTPALARTRQALDDDRRLLALLRLASAREGLSAAEYLAGVEAPAHHDAARFEAEWTRMGRALSADLARPAATAFAGIRPALARALAEAAAPQVKVYYDASLDYGKSTTPDSGLYYLGAARAAREFVAFLRSLPATKERAPAARSLAGELDALEGEMLAAYRPPLSIDRHRDFILAHSALKEARELDALGLRYGALLRYLQAAVRFGPLRTPAPAVPRDLDRRLREQKARLQGPADHSIGRLFVEVAEADRAEHAQDGAAVNAAVVVADVLPRYFAALQPGRPVPAAPAPTVTVTLVRWPYT